ncbi:hypothetical protein SJAG_05222 [Schizosaccharomyces japonicus yFS275]|uniref:AMMECR1 domain-containing protein n=1 Tax=Schizosaccharomyces japonicus (strain yFS275 / FY16936) TaxID=402676 RepID=B6K049_SCHJY|nr:hypothetical protein SJAG_05222 [Schizosaccharomyces japonicus yFS275]EEB06199.1 hypothetical protein SJAG_05222 [Schizosaccharomyces japonicus yFS275]
MATKEHCLYCLEIVNSSLQHRLPRDLWNVDSWTKKYPIFVKFCTIKKSGKELRGCIGTFQSFPLNIALEHFAKQAAFKDTRFKPLQLNELPKIECQVDVLVHFEKIASPLDWTVGVHGLWIKFDVKKKHYEATFLPSVAEEQGWNQEETLDELVYKAGYAGSLTGVHIAAERYQTSIANATFEEYLLAASEAMGATGI